MGDDTIYGGDNGTGAQNLAGGYGNDRIIAGSGFSGAGAVIRVFGDLYRNDLVSYSRRQGSPNDGDDIIDLGDSPDIVGGGQRAFGQGGNDKIFGGLVGTNERLYGGDGDDKLWAENPGQVETTADANWIFGNNGNDIIYGSVKRDRLYGDWARDGSETTIINDARPIPGKLDTQGGDDIIYTGVSIDAAYATGGDFVHGGWGNDKIYGQGIAPHWLNGEFGDDFIVGGDGGDYIYGDDYNPNKSVVYGDATPGARRYDADDAGVMVGDDTLYGGKGNDYMWGGAGDDYMHGEDDQDKLYAGAGDDVLRGGAGDDYLFTGSGWDTVFGGDGCDYLYT